jgi:radical SAM superfamily enzyme YgiQ (UPF0313 family)
MNGLIKRKYDFHWNCINLAIFMLDEEILELMRKSGSYQFTVSIESGNADVLKNIIKKPIDLARVHAILELAKRKGFEIIANFVIGFPGETWDQIRDTFSFAEKLDVDLVNFHIATPLPGTELMDICVKNGYIQKDLKEVFGNVGYTQGLISTGEFLSQDLKILRSFEWERINFRTEERKRAIASIQNISLNELESWRKNTLHNFGVNVVA